MNIKSVIMTLQSINPKNQSKVNKAIEWMRKYDDANDKRNLISDSLECDEQDSREWRAINRKCEQAFDRHLEIMDELPKGQQDAINKFLNQ